MHTDMMEFQQSVPQEGIVSMEEGDPVLSQRQGSPKIHGFMFKLYLQQDFNISVTADPNKRSSTVVAESSGRG